MDQGRPSSGLTPPEARRPAPISCDLSDKPLPITPDLSTSIGLDYERQVALGRGLRLRRPGLLVGVFTNTNVDPRLVQEACSLVNVRLGLRTVEGYDFSLFANNLFDEAVVVQDAVTTLFGKDPSYQRFLAPPREIGVTLRKAF